MGETAGPCDLAGCRAKPALERVEQLLALDRPAWSREELVQLRALLRTEGRL